MKPAVIGFRVKSGWAATVLLEGPATSPTVLDSRTILLSDPDEPSSRQPFHAGTGVAQTDRGRLKQLVSLVGRCAHRSVADLLAEYRADGRAVRGAAIVVGSDVDPERIANPHIRAHASEGRLFRTALEKALADCDLASAITLERQVIEQAAQTLRRETAELRSAVISLGRPVTGPWRAEQKTAALAAWTRLASSGPRGQL